MSGLKVVAVRHSRAGANDGTRKSCVDGALGSHAMSVIAEWGAV
jgi:hypothetical protein